MALEKSQHRQLTQLFGIYKVRLESLYDDFVDRLVALGYDESVLLEDALFNFDRFPELKTQLDSIFSDFVHRQTLCYKTSITDSVALAFSHDNAILSGVSMLSDMAVAQARKNAADAFYRSRMKPKSGLSLSRLVWNYAQQGKAEFEVAMSDVISDGLRKGTSAETLGRLVRGYLRNPDMMYRRYRHVVIDNAGNKRYVAKWHRRVIDSDGKVRFVNSSLEAVGQGQYRSARKNALRVMRTEINSAYHHARNERWKKEPFVIGQRIWLSPQHPHYDICDELAGDYPKDFLFAGWHPQCYSDDTEVLTTRGWQFLANVIDSDCILSLNPTTLRTEWVNISARQSYYRDEVMMHFVGDDIDLLVTPDHRIVYLSQDTDQIAYCYAAVYASKLGGMLTGNPVARPIRCLYFGPQFYSGMVYDLTLERNHIMYVRRNGKCMWGSNCLCASSPITLQGDERKDYYKRLAAGEDMSGYVSPNSIEDVPQPYKEYVANHWEEIARADSRGKLAWHFRDNRRYWEDIIEAN